MGVLHPPGHPARTVMFARLRPSEPPPLETLDSREE